MRWIKLQGRRGLAKREVAQQTRQYYLTVLNGIARIKALETTLLGYERGNRTGVDVLDTQRQLYATRRDLTTARYDCLNNRLRLLSSTGTLDEAELESINRQLGDIPVRNNGES